MMGSWVLCVGLVFLHISWTVEAKLHYAVIFPSELRSQHPETMCLQLQGVQKNCSVLISIHLDGKSTTLMEKSFEQDVTFTCSQIQIPHPDEKEAVGVVTALIEHGEDKAEKSTKVLVKKTRSSVLVQTDKSVYKPGQTVKFRVMSLDEDLHLQNISLPVVELQDPGKNRIGQWLNANLKQGMAEFSLPLSSEPPQGEYSIRVKDTVHTFTVEEYVLPKFEVTLQLPKFVLFNIDQFPVQVCGRYTYGKPVQGNYTVSVCRRPRNTWSRRRLEKDIAEVCAKFTGELDKSGCHTIDVEAENFTLSSKKFEKELRGTASVTEEGTGIELSTTSTTRVSNVINKVSFVDADANYKAGIPYNGVIKVVDAGDDAKPGVKVYLKIKGELFPEDLVTNHKGEVSFTLNTTEWQKSISVSVKTNLTLQPYVSGVMVAEYGEARMSIKPFYSTSKSFLKLHSVDKVLPCEGQREVQVQYIIKQSELMKEGDHLDLHYLVTSQGSIEDHGSVEISTVNKNEDLHGTTTVKFALHAGKSSTLRALVYILLPGGEILADSANYKVQRCFTNKVSVGFSPEEVLPGSEVSLQVQAAPGSLCGLRVVDESVVLMKPGKELTADKVYNLFPSRDTGGYDSRVQEDYKPCASYSPFMSRRHRYFMKPEKDVDVDVYSLFEGVSLKLLTCIQIRKPVECNKESVYTRRRGPMVVFAMTPTFSRTVSSESDIDFIEHLPVKKEEKEPLPEKKEEKEPEKVRTYFPETWMWELLTVGDSGSVELHHTAPDTITDWNAGAVCLGSSGFGLSPATSLRVFQPFFVDLTLPYSVVRGETFTLKASVFNYLKQCIKIKITLGPTEELEQTPCADCVYSLCLCADESKTFRWNLKAMKLGEVNITVRTEAVNTKELCHNEIPVVPKQGATDTIVKPVLVQPGGILVEKSQSSFLCIQEGEESKTEEVSLKFPKKILKDSERAYVTVLGDIMGTALQNLDRLLAMPYGCGEQNMVLFAPNIFVMQYLEKTNQITHEIKSKATKFLESGYQRQLTYKRDDGSYSAFGKHDPEGNTWLTAFVVKSFSKARPYIFIDDSHLKHSSSWLQDHRNERGCFRSVGRLFNNAMKGGVDDEISLSAYVTMALLEAGFSAEVPLVKEAVSCLRAAAPGVSNVYTQALLAYTFTLCGETELRKAILAKLEEKAIRGDRQVHWKRDTVPPVTDSYWYRASSAEVEMTAYVLLALLSGPQPDLGKAAEIVNWLSKQQNPYGGFSSTQDTVVALQALAKYAEATFSDKGNVTVTVSSSKGYLEKFHVDNNNRLLLQRASLPAVKGAFTVTTAGSGCVYVQTAIRYNVPPARRDTSFSLTVTPHSNEACEGKPVTNFEVQISAAYIGSREKSNMAVIQVKMLSGFIPIKSTIRKLEKDKLIQRSEIQTDVVNLYLNEMGHDPVNLSFMVEQDIEVKDLKPATAKVYDYYETDEEAVAEYNHPCSPDGSSSNSR
ncbi:alpha-2-macroglobulin-like [Hyperolius riggenbachi]|uniref:alpha-2-macroglobulin-like n=1 Tax=Hyperolius riggenbachi TaxID=752182 RepID=UPI0035A36BBA